MYVDVIATARRAFATEAFRTIVISFNDNYEGRTVVKMNLDLIFFTQLGTFVSWVVLTLGLYKLLVSSKDATIENLKIQIEGHKSEIEKLRAQGPDVVTESLSRTNKILKEQLSEQKAEIDRFDEVRTELKKQMETSYAGIRNLLDVNARNVFFRLVDTTVKLGEANARSDIASAQLRTISETGRLNIEHVFIERGLHRVLRDFVRSVSTGVTKSASDADLNMRFKEFLDQQSSEFSALVSQDVQELREAGLYIRGQLTSKALFELRKFAATDEFMTGSTLDRR